MKNFNPAGAKTQWGGARNKIARDEKINVCGQSIKKASNRRFIGIWDDQWDVVKVTKYFEFARSRKRPASNDTCG